MKSFAVILFSVLFGLQSVIAQEKNELLSYFRNERFNVNRLIDAKILTSKDSFLLRNKDVIFSMTDHEIHLEQTNDIRVNQLANIDDLQSGEISNFILNGAGVEVFVFDAGKVLASHDEFNSANPRIVDLENGSLGLSVHSTAVSGIIGAEGVYDFAGVNAASKGVLPEATIKHAGFSQTVNGDRFTKMLAYDAFISNHSYSSNNGWTNDVLSNLGPGYYYSVDSSLFPDSNTSLFGAYNTIDYSFDRLVYSNPKFIVVKSSGNDYGKGPGLNDPKFRWSEFGYVPFSSTDIVPVSNCDGGAYCISNGSLAKNIIVVGSVNLPNLSYNTEISPSNIVRSSFSNVGPRKDGAIKPDLVAVGANVFVLTHSGPAWMKLGSGTSFSAPVVTGVVGALTQLKRLLINDNQFNYEADEMKALLVHTAMEAGENEGPDNWFGWGLVDAKSAAELIIAAQEGVFLFNKEIKTSGVNYERTIVAKPNEKIKATLSWVDPAANLSTLTQESVLDTSSKLVNDFDLRIVDTVTNQVYLPWKLDLNNVTGAAIKGDNTVDNVEQVIVPNPVVGRIYKVVVSNKGTLVNHIGVPSPQAFALISTGGSLQTLNVEGNILTSQILVYPTLVQENVNIETDLQIIKINVLDVSGKILISTTDKNIDLSSFSTGIYILNINTDEGVLTKKIVKQ